MGELKHYHTYITEVEANKTIYSSVLFDLKVYHAHRSNMVNLKNFLEVFRANREAFSELRQIHSTQNQKVPGWSLDGPRLSTGGGGYVGGYGGGSRGGSGDSSGGFEPPDDGGNNFFAIILFGSGLIVIGNVLGQLLITYGSRLIDDGLTRWLECSRKTLDTPPKRPLRFGEVALLLRGVSPLLLSGALLTACTFILTPERLQAVLGTMIDLMALAAQEVGHAIIAVLPPPMRQIAQYFGRFIALAGVPIRFILERGILLVQILRNLIIVFCGAFMLLKGITLSVQLAALMKGDKIMYLIQNLQEETLAQTTPVLLYTIGVLKSLCFFIVPYLPRIPRCNIVISRIFFLTVIACLVSKDPFVLRTRFFFSTDCRQTLSAACNLKNGVVYCGTLVRSPYS